MGDPQTLSAALSIPGGLADTVIDANEAALAAGVAFGEDGEARGGMGVDAADYDRSGRPGLVWQVPFTRAAIGTFDVELAHEFFQGFVNHAGVTLHVDNLRGENSHHQCETVFKAFARALRMAIEADPRTADTIPSTKGSL